MPIGLVGGNEFRENCVSMDRALLEATGKATPMVVIVPTAAARENPSLAAANGIRYFQNLGAEAISANVVDRVSANAVAVIAPIENADVVYLTGGNPWYLLEALRDTRALDAIRQALADRRIVAGSSAGAMVLGHSMASRDWSTRVPALGLAGRLAVLPHHRSTDDSRARQLGATLDSDVAIFGIEEATGCLGEDGDWRVVGIGSVSVYNRDVATAYGSGTRFHLA